MANPHATLGTARSVRGWRVSLLALTVLLASGAALPARSSAGGAALSEADQQCLGCHSAPGLEKLLDSGDKLSLTIAAEAFAKSVHGVMGCTACHADIDLGKHPGVTSRFATAREYSAARSTVCRQCHEESFKQREASTHGLLERAGSRVVPVCSDCHGAHAVSPNTDYQVCVRCHAAAPAAHEKWLPNAALHLETVSCAACHSPSAARMVDLRLYDEAAQKWVVEPAGESRFQKLARSLDKDGNGLDPGELRLLLEQMGNGSPKVLRGRIDLRSRAEAHRLSVKPDAIRVCDNCHYDGAEPFRTVAVSVVSADGRPQRYEAQKQVLSSVLSMETLRQFYAIGGTRNPLLDGLLILAVVGGLSVPVGHQLLKRILRRRGDRPAADSSPES